MRRDLEKVVQTLPTPLFPDVTPHSSGISICGRHQHRKIKCTYRFATWNVRTLLDTDASDRPARRTVCVCTALVAAELHRYNVDIAALSETRLADEGSLTEVGGATLSSGRVFLPTALVYTALASLYVPLFSIDFQKPQWLLMKG